MRKKERKQERWKRKKEIDKETKKERKKKDRKKERTKGRAKCNKTRTYSFGSLARTSLGVVRFVSRMTSDSFSKLI